MAFFATTMSPGPINQFEQARLDRIAENRRRMEEIGVLESANELLKLTKPISKPAPRRIPKGRRPKTRFQPVRRSGRVAGEKAEFAGLDGEEGFERVRYVEYESPLEDLLADDTEVGTLSQEKQEQFQELRCGSTGRGSLYDKVAGITCHFCRQKKLCGEEGCPRCSQRKPSEDCIGKTNCTRCKSACGIFCRACLQIRYGEKLEDVREQMAAGTWLCPHCYEDDHPEEGWICNSSICLTRRGYKPTGIAIYDAQNRGFPSVAHWMQAQLRKRADGKAAGTSGCVEVENKEKEEEEEAATGSCREASSCDSSGSAAAAVAPTAVGTPGKRVTRGGKAAAAAAAAPAAEAAAAAVVTKKKGGAKQKKAPGSSSNGSEDGSGRASRQGSSGLLDASVAPPTPVKQSEPITPGAAAAAAGRRTTRATVAVCGARVVGAPDGGAAVAAKRACVGEHAGVRRGLRFRK